jgi:hypothetical protein
LLTEIKMPNTAKAAARNQQQLFKTLRDIDARLAMPGVPDTEYGGELEARRRAIRQEILEQLGTLPATRVPCLAGMQPFTEFTRRGWIAHVPPKSSLGATAATVLAAALFIFYLHDIHHAVRTFALQPAAKIIASMVRQ